MQCGIQLTINVLARAFHSGLSIAYFVVYTTSSRSFGGAASARTLSVDAVRSLSPAAVSLSTYSPGTEKPAVVLGAVALANGTAPGPLSLLQRITLLRPGF